MHHAAKIGDPQLIILLLKRGASMSEVDNGGKTPLDYALEKSGKGGGWVKIVTILRLTVLNRENSSGKGSISGFKGNQKELFLILVDRFYS